MDKVRIKRIDLTERQYQTVVRALEMENERLMEGKEFSQLPEGRQDSIVQIDGILDRIDAVKWQWAKGEESNG